MNRKSMMLGLVSVSLMGCMGLAGCENNEANQHNRAMMSSYYKAHPNELKKRLEQKSPQQSSVDASISSKNAKLLSQEGMSSTSSNSSMRHEVVHPNSNTKTSGVQHLSKGQQQSQTQQVDAVVKILKPSQHSGTRSKAQWINILHNENLNMYSVKTINQALQKCPIDFNQAALRFAKSLSGSRQHRQTQLVKAQFSKSQIAYALDHLH